MENQCKGAVLLNIKRAEGRKLMASLRLIFADGFRSPDNRHSFSLMGAKLCHVGSQDGDQSDNA